MKNIVINNTFAPDSFTPASYEEKNSFQEKDLSDGFIKDAFKRLLNNKIACFCLVFLLFISVLSIVLPAFWPYGYDDALGLSEKYQLPDPSYINLSPFEYSETEKEKLENGEFVMPHIFGTDNSGYDYFIRVLYGVRVSLSVGLFASIIVLITGTLLGSIAGYFSGKIDLIIMRIVDVIYALPDMLMVILLSSVLSVTIEPLIKDTFLSKLGTNMISLFMVFALFYWVSMARLIRGQMLSLREQEYVLAAKSAGAGNGYIIKKHLIPNCISVITVSTALQIPNAIFTESYLSFLGLGVNAPMPSLGSLASEALISIETQPYLLLAPAIIISMIVLSLNLLGDGLRDAFDPKLKL